MRSLVARLSGIPEETGQAPWPDHEYVRGWGVFGLAFDSGHVLALRVFPQSTFGSYRTVWRRDPEGTGPSTPTRLTSSLPARGTTDLPPPFTHRAAST